MQQHRKYEKIIITGAGGPEVLKVVEAEAPALPEGFLGIQILASGVAFGDILKRQGNIPGLPKVPFTPGYDLVGVIDEVGGGVTQFEVGQRVAAFVQNGGNSDYIQLPEYKVVGVPESVDTLDAACIILNYVSAWQMLRRISQVCPKERILVHGAAGGVGTAFLQLGQILNLEMYGTASSTKHELIKSLGGIPIDYKKSDFVDEIMRHTGDGVDVVFDPIGGDHLRRSHRVLRKKGRLVSYGVSSSAYGGKIQVVLSLLPLLRYKILHRDRRAFFYGIGNGRQSTQAIIQEDLKFLLGMLEEKKIKPVLGAKYKLSEIVQAHQTLEKSSVTGKVLIVSG